MLFERQRSGFSLFIISPARGTSFSYPVPAVRVLPSSIENSNTASSILKDKRHAVSRI